MGVGKESLRGMAGAERPKRKIDRKRRIERSWDGAGDSPYGDSDARFRLLIVAALFFIQRPTGEVAEWSKALPC